jgi:uncharacterized protein (TIGR03905 family)
MTIQFKPRGVCPQSIFVELEDEIIRSVRFEGGCSGNLTGIATLVEGMHARDAIKKIKGIRCGPKPTSCPDQLSRALEEALAKM